MNFDVTSAPLAVVSGTFDASQLIVLLLAANADYRDFGSLAGTFGSDQLPGSTSSPNQLASGSITRSGNLETLLIPINAQIFDSFFQNPADISVTGQIVATAVVPEPNSLALAGLGLAVFGWWGRSLICQAGARRQFQEQMDKRMHGP